MPTLVIYSDVSDGFLVNQSTTYSTARAGGGTWTINTTGTVIQAGQFYNGSTYYIYEGFLSFKTSVLSGLNITDAVISVWPQIASGSSNGTLQSYLKDWGTSLSISDWASGASLPSLTKIAHYTGSFLVTSAYYDFINDNLLSNLNISGYTRLVFAVLDVENFVQPTSGTTFNTGVYQFLSSDYSLVRWPKLTISYRGFSVNSIIKRKKWFGDIEEGPAI